MSPKKKKTLLSKNKYYFYEIEDIVCNHNACTVLDLNQNVFAWGDPKRGGNIGEELANQQV